MRDYNGVVSVRGRSRVDGVVGRGECKYGRLNGSEVLCFCLVMFWFSRVLFLGWFLV